MAKGLDYVINLLSGSSEGVDLAKSRIGEVDAAVAGAGEHVGGFGKAIGELGLVIGGMFATEKIIDFGKESLEAAKSIRMATAQVAQGIETTGGAAGKTMDDFLELAEKIKHTTLFSKADALTAESQLETFTAIKGVVFDQAIPAILSLATRMGGDGPADLKGALLQVSKALQDPERNLGRLQRSGVDFTKAQTELIKGLAQHNHLAQAQKLILQEVNKEFGGSAEAARKAVGPQADLKEAYDGLAEAIGPLLQQGISPFVVGLTATVNRATQLVGQLHYVSDAAKDVYGWIVDNADGLRALGVGAAAATIAYGAFNTELIVAKWAQVSLAVANGYAAASMAVETAAMWALNVAMDANPVGLLIVGIGALVGWLYYAYEKSEVFRAALSGIGAVASELLPIFKGLGEQIVGAFTFNPALFAKGILDAAQGLHDFSAGAFSKAYNISITESHKQVAKDKASEAAAAVLPGTKEHVKQTPGVRAKGAGANGFTSGTISNQSTASGKQVKNLTINIGSLVKDFKVEVTNITGQGAVEIKRIVTQMLVEAARDGELLMGD